MKTEQDDVRISIRFPCEVAEAMRRLARTHDRSLNGEMVRVAREHLAPLQSAHLQTKREREGTPEASGEQRQ